MKINYYSAIVLASTLLTVNISSAHAQGARIPRYVASYDSFGPVKVGMRISEASKALGVPLVRGQGQEEACYYVTPWTGLEGVSFMVTQGRIARVDIEAKSYRTERGARIGDTESRVKRLYKGRVRVSPHKYVDWAHYLIVESRGGKFMIVFETDGKRVTSYRVGKNPEAGYVEGCS
jgi:hypothetical protein